MVRRGDDLREHVLWAAKEVFLEVGFERASMDDIAARAGTTKRSLYAHFESKEKLFLAVLELSRSLSLGRLRTPAEYADDQAEALVLFCARFLEQVLWFRSVRMYRLTIAEQARFPEGAAQLHEVVFGAAEERVQTFLRERLALSKKDAARAASELLGRVLYPRFTRALFGLEVITDERLDDERLSDGIDLKPIRRAVAAVLERARA